MPTSPTTPPAQPSQALPPYLATLYGLSDAELAAIAEDELSAGDVTRLQWLLEENADNALGTSERAELAARAAAAEALARRKEYAAAILAQRQSGTTE